MEKQQHKPFVYFMKKKKRNKKLARISVLMELCVNIIKT